VNGILKQFAVDEPRLTDGGLLCEKASTNLITQSSNLGATWTLSNVSRAAAIGIDGTASGSELTASAINGTASFSHTAVSAAFTFSLYIKRVTGTGVIMISVDNGASYTEVLGINTDEFVRGQVTVTVANPVCIIKIVDNTDVIVVDGCQLEDSTYATSPILTAGTTETRNADNNRMVVTQSGYLDWFNDAVGCFVVRANVEQSNLTPLFYLRNDADTGDYLNVSYQYTSDRNRYYAGYTGATWYTFKDDDQDELIGDMCIATSYIDDLQLAAINGINPAYPASPQTTSLDFTTIDRLQFGGEVAAGNMQQCYIKTLAYYDSFVPQNQLQLLSI